MSKLTVKTENGRFYLKSGNNWTLWENILKT